MRYVLDSTFLIDHLRSDPAAMVRLERMYADGDDPIVTAVTTTEVWAGRKVEGDPAIDAFLRYFEYVHAGPSTARLAGEWRAKAREIGLMLKAPDAIIAATAFDLGATVLTRNVRDYELTPVRVETY
jgi:predicted nucleic acid-binding protein